MTGRHVFVSYGREDRWYVERLVGHLRDAGLEVRWDGDLSAGDRWQSELMEWVRSADAVVVIMTDAAEESENVENEIRVAIDDANAPILPLLLSGRPFDSLRAKHFEDVAGGAMPSPAFLRSLGEVTAQDVDDNAVGLPGGLTAPPEGYAAYIDSAETRQAAELMKEAGRFVAGLRFTEAHEKLDESLTIAPDFVPALVNRSALLNNQREWSGALEAANRAIVVDSTNHYGHGNRAAALAGLGRVTEALPAIEQALALQADNVHAHWLHGGILFQLGEFDQAVDAYDRALALSPDLKPLQYVRRIAALRKWTSRVGRGLFGRKPTR